MKRVRALEIGEDVVAVLAEVLGDDDEALDGGAGVAWVLGGDCDTAIGGCEGGVGVAVAEVAVADDIGAGLGVERRGVRGRSRNGVDDGIELAVRDFDSVECVFGRVPVAGHHDADGFADVPNSVDR